MNLHELLTVANETQAEKIKARIEHGTNVAAARAIGCSETQIRRAIKACSRKLNVHPLARGEGWVPVEVTDHFDGEGNRTGTSLREAPADTEETGGVGAGGARDGGDGYIIKGVSTYFNANGEQRGQWVKTRLDAELAREAFEKSIRDLCDGTIQPVAPRPAPSHCNEDLLTVIPMGDPHFGLRSWAMETGENFDLDIAERLTFDAVDRLCDMTPSTGKALLLNLGDYFHADDSTNRTPRGGNVLDVDGRFAKIASIGFRAMIRCIERLLKKHGEVIVRNNPGNHDPHQAVMLNIAVGARFHDEPRVHVDPSPSSFYFYRFGKVLIGSTHGDGAKLPDLPLIMANDVPQDWAAADHRVWHCGHFHHNQKLGQKDLTGCEVETHRTLAAGDAWHKHHGYRAGRDMKAIVYSRKYGEVNRVRCGVEMLEQAA